MSKESWAITSTKRKAKSVTPAPRKRPRCHDVEREAEANEHSKRQRTLTQVQWVTPTATSFEQDDSLQDMPRTRTARARELKKRNSTLTQMDFFSFPPPDHDEFDDEMMLPPQQQELTLPQFDGSYESPRRPRKRKSIPPTTARSAKRKNTASTLNSQEYVPSRKKGNQSGVKNEQSVTPRRVSSRIASKQGLSSDATENLEYFQQALGIPEESIKDKVLPNSLEIKALVDEGQEILADDTKTRQTLPLRTPEKSRMVILSSQSPESLPPSTQRSKTNASAMGRHSLRTPLVERSVNYLLSPSKGSSGKSRDSRKRSPGKGKVVVLKLPKRKRPRPTPRLDNSEAGLWSIPSSSPRLQPQVEGVRAEQQAVAPASELEKQDMEREIPATSQGQKMLSSPSDALTQDSLPDLADIVGRRSPSRDEAQRNSSLAMAQVGEESPVLVRDFAPPTQTGLEASMSESTMDAEIHNDGPLEGGAEVSGEDLDLDELAFGSPIANDTQFNIGLKDRVSSPSRQSRALVGLGQRSVMTLSSTSPPCRGRPSKPPSNDQPQDEELPPQRPLPCPRLVESPCKRTPDVQGDHEEDHKEVTLPTPALMHHSSTVVSVTKVPLNDTLQHSSSSSPLLSARAITQKSIHPASIPHPSQMSTQEATQASPNMSSYPQRHETDITQRPDQITIKDSSSFRVPLSQLPQYAGKSQSQCHPGSGINEVFDSEDEGDLDLDPPSLPPPPEKPLGNDGELTPRQGGIKDIKEDEHDDDGGSQSMSQIQDLGAAHTTPIRSSQAVSIPSSPSPLPLQREYSPIPGFNNDTQSNFTQNGHVTAAYIHRQREAGNIPKWYVPQPYQVPGYTRRK
ncbi:hypothetical protein RBB50_004289 [Rhinocladiella similis]